MWFLYGFKSDLLLSFEFQQTAHWAVFLPVGAWQRHRVAPRKTTTIIQAHLIAALFILSKPGQPVKYFAEQVAYQNIPPFPSMCVSGLNNICLVVQDYAEEAVIDCHIAAVVVIDKAELLEPIHEMADLGQGGANHL